jgi:hypothetical protein
MTLYVFDSDTHTLLTGGNQKIEARVRAVTAPDRLATTVIPVAESILAGMPKSVEPRRRPTRPGPRSSPGTSATSPVSLA